LLKGLKLAAVLGTGALALVACAAKPADTASSSAAASDTSSASASASDTSSPSPTAASFSACMVTDTGGVDDRSFNAAAWAGMQQAQKDLGVAVQYLESKADADYTPNINALIQKKCDIIVTVGFLMGDATKAAAKKNPDSKFAIVDQPSDPTLKNYKGLEFNTAQAAFQAGYLAAAQSKTGKVGTYGGLAIPPVTIYMDGFAEGVAYYNKAKGKNVQVLGWDEKTQKGSFAGGFTDKAKGSVLATGLMQQGADIIFPVAGGVGLGSAAAAKASGKANLIWVDQDGYDAAPDYKALMLSSVLKGISAAVFTAVKEASAGSFTATHYVGTLDNGGVALAPFHDFDSKVDAATKSELDQIKADITSGKIVIASKSQPAA
jgi:basic membrane protein A and related proteins